MSPTSRAVRRRTAYVLDDDPGIRKFVCRLLAQNDCEAFSFATAALLMERLSLEPPDVLILDLALGESDAVEVIRHLEVARYLGIVLLISGKSELILAEMHRIGQAHGLAMLPPLQKPFRASQFMDRLSTPAKIRDAAPQRAAAAPAISVKLADALSNDWLELWYQPKFNLRSREVCGAEALLRVRHPELGVIPPSGFLPPSSDPLHHDLAKYILRQVIADWTNFAAGGAPLPLAVNMPVSIIIAPGFVKTVRDSLPNDPRFPGLVIEVTEDEAIEDAALIKETATQLGLYNVRLSVDDFGTAHSSLSRFLDVSFAEVKLDRSFVTDCGVDPIRRALCQTVVDLAHRFGAVGCAEGVETEGDLNVLTTIGCDVAQGYFIARPKEPALFAASLAELSLRFSQAPSPSARTSEVRASRVAR